MAEAAVVVLVEAPGMVVSARVVWEHASVAACEAHTAHIVVAAEVEVDILSWPVEASAVRGAAAAVVVAGEEAEEAVSLL